VVVSLALVGFGLAAAYSHHLGRPARVGRERIAVALAGGLLVVLSFTLDAPALMDGHTPGWYPWPVFAAGMSLAGWAAWTALLAGEPHRLERGS
jgi:drug/metabolite transporter (DMT)-like permease